MVLKELREQIIDKAFSSVYVPKWVINIESQNRIYAREIIGVIDLNLFSCCNSEIGLS